MYWLTGFLILLVGTITGATRVVTKQTFSPELLSHLIEEYKITFLLNAPHQVTLTLKHETFKKTNFSSVKYWMVGGSKAPSSTVIEVNKYLTNGGIYNIYGMSEVAGAISTELLESRKTDSVGQLMYSMTAKIVDEFGERCGTGIDGEVCLKSNYKFLGYYGNEKATKELFDDEGFMMTGDIGHFDEGGFLCLVDRKKDLLKYQNFQISPSEIESFLLNLPQVKSACVIGIPDNVAGDLPAAAIVRNSDSISKKEIFDAVAGKIYINAMKIEKKKT